ncbi:RNA polymerase sigma-70 factor, ECF subfamily [Neorhodopirellula lusitana]|uniref:RNA polymerase sigma-70 factor, ECF subfamily n=1 Tax=Neorhodopirellula lusitana TaxID=445327 RepID=A0ABY1PPB6_9BACT|nr:sigma-70 family RNA polymerase sigma factor [Neorhodopirellula lusitana]SMP38608.1 RNA polymerase sigma-70 factor, ECF subfamily [Neorhodopirellula lusitana]
MLESNPIESTIHKVVAGDRDAYRLIVREYQLMIRGYIGSQLHRADEMEDLSQEVFLTAYRNLDQYDGRGNFAAWLRGIARHQLLMHFRTTGRRKANDAKFREEVTQAIQHDLDQTFAEQTDFAVESLLRCISQLPERMKRVVRAGLDGTKAPALASELATSVGAIYNLHYRANGLLRECVKEQIQ